VVFCVKFWVVTAIFVRGFYNHVSLSTLRLKRDGTRAETRFLLSPKRTSPFKSVGASVQSTAGTRGVRISVSNAGYTTFQGSVTALVTHSIRQFPLHFSSRASPCAIRFQKHSTRKCTEWISYFLLFSLRSSVGKIDTSIKEHALPNIAVKCLPLLTCIREAQFRFLPSRPINLTKILWFLSASSAKSGRNLKLVTGAHTSFQMCYPFTILSLLVVKPESHLINYEQIKYVSYFIMDQFCIESLLALYWDPQL